MCSSLRFIWPCAILVVHPHVGFLLTDNLWLLATFVVLGQLDKRTGGPTYAYLYVMLLSQFVFPRKIVFPRKERVPHGLDCLLLPVRPLYLIRLERAAL